jgi:hypothetical protein
MMKHVALVVVLVLASGCLEGPAAVSTSARDQSMNGVVSGVVVTEGGPSVPDGSSGSDIRPVNRAQIRVTGLTSAGAKVVRYLITDSEGRFRVALAPGHYTIAAEIYALASNQPQRSVVVRSGQSVTIQIKGYVI